MVAIGTATCGVVSSSCEAGRVLRLTGMEQVSASRFTPWRGTRG